MRFDASAEAALLAKLYVVFAKLASVVSDHPDSPRAQELAARYSRPPAEGRKAVRGAGPVPVMPTPQVFPQQQPGQQSIMPTTNYISDEEAGPQWDA